MSIYRYDDSVGCYIWYREEGCRATARPGSLAVYHPSTASVLITVLLYDGPLLCGCNVPIKRTFVWLVKSILMRERLNSFCIFQLLKL